MIRNGWFFLSLVPVLIETLITWVRPEWLAVLPAWSIAGHTFTLRNPQRLTSEGYRDALALAPLPTFTETTDLTGAVLFARGGRVILRRAFGAGRRSIWVVNIEVQRTSETVTLRARQVFTPITLLLSAPLYAAAITHHLSITWTLGAFALVAAVHGLHTLFSRSARDVALQEAFRFLEEELRAGLERR